MDSLTTCLKRTALEAWSPAEAGSESSSTWTSIQFFSSFFVPMSLPPVAVEQTRSELARISVAAVVHGAHTAAFQPSCRPEHRIEDRDLANGTRKFVGVFDDTRIAQFASVYDWNGANSF